MSARRAELRLAHRAVVDLEDLHRILGGEAVLVDADDHVLAAVDARLLARGRFLDTHLGHPGLDGACHAALLLDFADQLPGAVGDLLRQRLHQVGAAPGIDRVGDAGFLLDDQLRVARDAGRELRRQRDGLVERVGVQRLRAAEDRRHGLDRGAHHVVVRILLGERPARGLAVRAQHLRLRALRVEAVDDPRPQQARGAQLGHFHVEVHADAEEERQPRREFVDLQTRGDRGAHVFLAVGQRVGELQRGVGAGFLDVVAGDRDRVEPRHVARGIGDDVADDPHRGRRRIDVGIADHELLEDVVLDRAGELVRRHALLFRRDDVAGQHRQHRAVHRHRHRDLVERDAVEQDLHVLDAVDRHACLAHVADDARVVRVVAAVRGEVEGHRDALAAGGERLAVERVGFLGGRETRVLADRPRTAHVHRGLRAAHEGLDAGQRVRERQRCRVLGRVERLQRDALGCGSVQRLRRRAAELLGGELLPVGQRGPLRAVVLFAHLVSPQWCPPAGGWLSSISTPSQLFGWMKITRQSCAPGPGSSLRNW